MYVYRQDTSEGVAQPIFRVRLSDRGIARVASIEQVPLPDARFYSLVGFAPNNSPLASVVLGNSDIYALDVNFP